MIPFSPVSGAAANVTLFSYDGNAHIGVNSDRAAVPEPDGLLACLEQGLDEVTALGEEPGAAPPAA